MIGFPVAPWKMIEGISRRSIGKNREISEWMRELSGRVLNMHYTVEKPEMFNRHTVSLACVERSFELLDELCSREDPGEIAMLEEAYKTGWHDMEGRFGESLISAWTVCEQIISRKWDELLRSNDITGKRKKKLQGIDYTISQKIEFLNIS